MAKQQGPIAKLYLFAYNIVQFLGWGYCGVRFLQFMISKQGNHIGAWDHVAAGITFFQTLQELEVLHCVLRLVPSDVIQTQMQILSRLLVVWGILRPVAETRESYGVPLLLFAWCLAECTRYIYYALNLYDAIPTLLTWCRYTFFIALYPIGVTGELLVIYSGYKYVQRTGMWSWPMPNPINIGLHYDWLLIVIAASYIPFFPQLYGYMLRQRKKFVGPQPVESSKKTK
ncbi:Very-long-chain (3R)-3-hydroxyacyl-CoA dehydratase 1 [Halotydeus destructor]|nr:Very-long-chain (3R)-3-hydroxyacyl-CoA dehydratase 1 [Halotydeus destructor]